MIKMFKYEFKKNLKASLIISVILLAITLVVLSTSNFVYDKENKKAFGEISKVANILSYIIGVKDETAKEPENLSNKDIEDITGEELPAATEEEKLESVEIPDKLDITPWLGMISLSLLLMIVSGIVMFRDNRI